MGTLLFCLSISMFLMASIFQGCYSSTAVKGTPVKEMVAAKDERVFKYVATERDREVLKALSKVKENSVFTEISGIPEYLVGPLDVLEINSHIGDKIKTTKVTVNSRGLISYSFIDDLKVEGLTSSQIDDLLTRKMSDYIRNPRIDILVQEFKSKTATVIGEFAKLRSGSGVRAESGRIPLKGKTTLMDLVAEAGGYTENADVKNTRLIRRGKTYMINLFDIIEKGDESQNIIIDDGDIVDMADLPEFGERVYVMGEVVSQGVYPLDDVQDLLGAIALAGSITRLAVEENTLIVRNYGPGKEPLVMMADLKAILREADISQNIPLENGDLVYVPRMRIGDINDWIANTMPLLNFILYPGQLMDAYSTGWKKGFNK